MRLCSAKSRPISESLKAGTNTGTFFSYADFRMPRSFTFSLRCLPMARFSLCEATISLASQFFRICGDDALHEVEVRLRLQRVVHAVVAGLVQLDVVHLRVVAEVRAPRGLHQPVRHQRAGGDNGVDDAVVNQIGDHQPLLGDGHRARQRHHDETLFVARHGFQHVGAFAHLPPGECRVAHRADQVIHGLDLRQVERLQRYQLVGNGIVQFALNAFAVRFVVFVAQRSPRIERP